MVRTEDERAQALRALGAEVVVGNLLDLDSMHREARTSRVGKYRRADRMGYCRSLGGTNSTSRSRRENAWMDKIKRKNAARRNTEVAI